MSHPKFLRLDASDKRSRNRAHAGNHHTQLPFRGLDGTTVFRAARRFSFGLDLVHHFNVRRV